MMRIIVRIVISAIISVGLDCAWIENVTAQETRPRSLSDIVFFGVWHVKELKQHHNSEGVEICVRRYLEAIPPTSILWATIVLPEMEDALNARRRHLIEQMVTILGENVRIEAESFASTVPLQLEWEGMSEGPLDEAEFADKWINRHPETSIGPFLHLFMAHRLRAGYEAARARHESGLWPILASQYHESLDKARSSANPLIFCIANDMENQSYVYLRGQNRP
ncbi:MAG: hypothetical protein EHM85_19400 [Desulfobacteraceae bacterium]|nr:MAG: hypothetical protein EHM85_19400 [Desulfobacteraceae bacterium]